VSGFALGLEPRPLLPSKRRLLDVPGSSVVAHGAEGPGDDISTRLTRLLVGSPLLPTRQQAWLIGHCIPALLRRLERLVRRDGGVLELPELIAPVNRAEGATTPTSTVQSGNLHDLIGIHTPPAAAKFLIRIHIEVRNLRIDRLVIDGDFALVGFCVSGDSTLVVKDTLLGHVDSRS